MLRKTIKCIKPCIVCIFLKKGNEYLKTGSGFIVSPDGYILTCRHVIKSKGFQSDNIAVGVLDSPEPIDADVEWSDKKRDLAIIKIDKKDLKYLELGDYENIEEGTTVAFCGYPFETLHPVTHQGIISAKTTLEGLDVVQIDGSVNRGFSGGPLFTIEDGRVIGVLKATYGNIGDYLRYLRETAKGDASKSVKIGPLNVQLFTREVISVIDKHIQLGMGYAIPINHIKEKLNNIKKISSPKP